MSQNVRNEEALHVQLLPEDPLVDKSFTQDGAFRFYPKERGKTFLAVFLMLLAAYVNGAVAALITDFVPRKPLPDLVFEYVPEQPWAWQVSDTIACSLGITNIFFGVLHQHRWIVCRRFCLITAQLYLLRAICMGVTWVAVPGEFHRSRCVEPADPDHFWLETGKRIAKFLLTFGVLPMEKGSKLFCGDLIFSGHTLVMVVSWYTVSLYLPLKRCRPVIFIFGFGTIVGMVLIILCRMHYTVDVILALIITSSFYAVFHFVISSPSDDQWINRLKFIFWLLPFVRYFESNVPCAPVPRKLEWPFSKPSFCRKFVKQLNDY